MSTPEDTSQREPLVHLAGALVEGTSAYITGMEADGQRQIVQSDVLPRDCKDDDALLALGFTFGEATDDLFREATLPAGWSRKASDHDMWSYIVDERGIERVGLFYKAAFYDRSAHMSLTDVGSSFAVSFVYGQGPDATPWDLLTETERASFELALRDYIAEAVRMPDIYGERATRVIQRLRELER
jgi:hypothetical protein